MRFSTAGSGGIPVWPFVFLGLFLSVVYLNKEDSKDLTEREALTQEQEYRRELKVLDRVLFRNPEEGVVYREAQPIGTTGLSLIVVESAERNALFNLVVPSSTKLKKGDAIKYSTLTYKQMGKGAWREKMYVLR